MSQVELRLIVEMLRARPWPERLADARADFERFARNLPPPGDARIETLRVGGVEADRVSAPGGRATRCILYLHGGGYVQGSRRTHRCVAYHLSRAAQAIVLVLDYRLAPEHPFPAALEDTLSAWEALLTDGWEAAPASAVPWKQAAARMALVGDSAGGGLTLATLVSLRDRGVPLPAAAVCLSPWTDLAGTGASVTAKAGRDPVIQPAMIHDFARLYLQGQDVTQPLASPLYADLTGLPPLLIQVGSEEVLLDDSTRLADAARQAGVDVSLEVWPGMIHVWHLFAPVLAEGRQALDQAGAFLRRHWPAAEDSGAPAGPSG